MAQVPPAEMRQRILRAMSTLPPLHDVARRLIRLMGSDCTSATDLDRIIRNDQALSARVLKHANASVYGKSRSIASLTEAVVLLGDQQLTDLVLGVSIDRTFGSATLSGFGQMAWDHSMDCAAAARALAVVTGSCEPDTAFVAGLMHDIGLLVMAQAAPDEVAALLERASPDPLAAERQALGLNHAQVGQRLLEHWNLPPSLCEAVRLHHAPARRHMRSNPLVNLVALADVLAALDGIAFYPASLQGDLFGLLRMCAVVPERLGHLFAELERSRDETRRLLRDVRGDAADEAMPVAAAAPLNVVVFATDELRRSWYEAVLRHLGCRVLGGQTGRAAGTGLWLVADLHGASPEARANVLSWAEDRGAGLVLAGPTVPPGAPWTDLPRLPAAVTRRCLEVLKLEPAAVPL